VLIANTAPGGGINQIDVAFRERGKRRLGIFARALRILSQQFVVIPF